MVKERFNQYWLMCVKFSLIKRFKDILLVNKSHKLSESYKRFTIPRKPIHNLDSTL